MVDDPINQTIVRFCPSIYAVNQAAKAEAFGKNHMHVANGGILNIERAADELSRVTAEAMLKGARENPRHVGVDYSRPIRVMSLFEQQGPPDETYLGAKLLEETLRTMRTRGIDPREAGSAQETYFDRVVSYLIIQSAAEIALSALAENIDPLVKLHIAGLSPLQPGFQIHGFMREDGEFDDDPILYFEVPGSRDPIMPYTDLRRLEHQIATFGLDTRQ